MLTVHLAWVLKKACKEATSKAHKERPFELPVARGYTGTNDNNHLLTNNKIVIIIEARSHVVHAGFSIFTG